MTRENYVKHLDSVGIKKYFGVTPKKKIRLVPRVKRPNLIEEEEVVETQVKINEMKRKIHKGGQE